MKLLPLKETLFEKKIIYQHWIRKHWEVAQKPTTCRNEVELSNPKRPNIKVRKLKLLSTLNLVQMNAWKITYLNCGEIYEFMIDHRSYTHNLSSCEIKAWKNIYGYFTNPFKPDFLSGFNFRQSAQVNRERTIRLRNGFRARTVD